VLAIDPTSPFSGGAILGDRVRMQDHATDPEVFIRSMATRGHLGGLALAVPEAIRLLDAVGKPWVIVETVGVGQVEVEVAGQADTTVVVVNPGWGDAVQANKAGLMEIADVFVINKAGPARRGRDPPGPGADAGPVQPGGLAAADRRRSGHRRHRHRRRLERGGGPPRVHREERSAPAAHGEERARQELRHIVAQRLEARARDLCQGTTYDELERTVLERGMDPWAATDVLLDGVGA
jgi:LAO/AO transport system kinase